MKRTFWFGALLFALCLVACTSVPPTPTQPLPSLTPQILPSSSPQPASTPTLHPLQPAVLPPLPASYPKIDLHPVVANWGRGALASVSAYDPNSQDPFQVDLRSYDLSALDLRQSADSLPYAAFDDRTVWPPADKMPADFDWQQIMEEGKNPGLGVRSLHALGITGRGVGIAIIDQELLVEHQEYADRLRFYEKIGSSQDKGMASMHAAAVASIAVGKTVGVAPEADLYFIDGFTGKCFGVPTLYHCLAQSIRRILEINAELPEGAKIRAISISRGHKPGDEGSDDWEAAIQEAEQAGILVANVNEKFGGLGREPLANPDDFQSYGPGLFWESYFYENPRRMPVSTPMDSRTTASPTGASDYVYYRVGGMSWSAPYVAGVYALAAQVDPTITPERFWTLAEDTGQMIQVVHDDKTYSFGLILDPVALIATLEQ